MTTSLIAVHHVKVQGGATRHHEVQLLNVEIAAASLHIHKFSLMASAKSQQAQPVLSGLHAASHSTQARQVGMPVTTVEVTFIRARDTSIMP